jgi:26S proteasome regulatory subunit T5
LLDVDPDQEENETEGANVDLDGQVKGKCAVIKTSTRQVKSLLTKQYNSN